MKLNFNLTLTLQLPDQICNSPYCQSYNSSNASSENLVLDQTNYPQIDSFPYSHHLSSWYFKESWSLIGVKGLMSITTSICLCMFLSLEWLCGSPDIITLDFVQDYVIVKF